REALVLGEVQRSQRPAAATSIFCAMRSTTCRARSMTIACRSYLDLRPPRSRRGAPRHRPVAFKVAEHIFPAMRLGRRKYRGDAELFPTATAASQAHEVDRPSGIQANAALRCHLDCGFAEQAPGLARSPQRS